MGLLRQLLYCPALTWFQLNRPYDFLQGQIDRRRGRIQRLLPQVQYHRLKKEVSLPLTNGIPTPETGIATLRQRREKSGITDHMAGRWQQLPGLRQALPVRVNDVEMHPEDHQPPVGILGSVGACARPENEAGASP